MGSEGTTAVVLCGGAARRFGADKTRALLGDSSLLERVVGGLPAAWPVLCVGPERPLGRDVQWVREDPPGGGPVAALAAALPLVTTPLVVVLGGDMPYAAGPAPGLVARLGADHDADAVAARDGDGRTQPLLAAYRVLALRDALPEAPAGTPLMRLLDALRVEVVDARWPLTLDVDTPADLEEARHRLEP
jgi:molybdopterin-guanine dinucleotide biosynthesis protein A